MAYSGSNIEGAPAAPKMNVWSVSPPVPPSELAGGALDSPPPELAGGASEPPVSAADDSGAEVAALGAELAALLLVELLRSELAQEARDTATVAASPATTQR